MKCEAPDCNALVARVKPTGGFCDNGHGHIFWGSEDKLLAVYVPSMTTRLVRWTLPYGPNSREAHAW